MPKHSALIVAVLFIAAGALSAAAQTSAQARAKPNYYGEARTAYQSASSPVGSGITLVTRYGEELVPLYNGETNQLMATISHPAGNGWEVHQLLRAAFSRDSQLEMFLMEECAVTQAALRTVTLHVEEAFIADHSMNISRIPLGPAQAELSVVVNGFARGRFKAEVLLANDGSIRLSLSRAG